MYVTLKHDIWTFVILEGFLMTDLIVIAPFVKRIPKRPFPWKVVSVTFTLRDWFWLWDLKTSTQEVLFLKSENPWISRRVLVLFLIWTVTAVVASWKEQLNALMRLQPSKVRGVRWKTIPDRTMSSFCPRFWNWKPPEQEMCGMEYMPSMLKLFWTLIPGCWTCLITGLQL